MKAKVYGCDPSKVTNYQQKVNDAAAELALNDPNLLLCRQKLLELARNKVNEGGYHFKKGVSERLPNSQTTKVLRKFENEAYEGDTEGY